MLSNILVLTIQLGLVYTQQPLQVSMVETILRLIKVSTPKHILVTILSVTQVRIQQTI